MAHVRFDKVVITYPGAKEPAVHEFTLDIKDGEFVVLVGPSGCGKSTTLRALAGLEAITSGAIHIGDKDITNVHPKDRDIAMVFQNYALYPHMTVEDNIGFSLKMAGVKKPERQAKVMEAARMLGLEDYLKRKPKNLSGGQRQRVAMGRAIVRNPNAFLMDEPLSNLDAKLRVSTRTQIAELQKKIKTTTIYVTHDQTEAMTMGDRIVIMKDGYIQQISTPAIAYQKPVNVFVAGFIGSPAMNLGTFRVKDSCALITGAGRIRLPKDVAEIAGDRIIVGIRPENLELRLGDARTEETLDIDLDVVEYMGSDIYGYGRFRGLDPEAEIQKEKIIIRTPGFLPIYENTTIGVVPSGVHFFDANTGNRLGDGGA
jgi:multiple sugar transport system ATP-binding protein